MAGECSNQYMQNTSKRETGSFGAIGKDYIFIHSEKSQEEIESDNQSSQSEMACGLMTWLRSDEDMVDWSGEEAAAQKAFDGWHKLGPQSAQY